MAYNWPRRSSELPSADPQAQNEGTIPAAVPHTAMPQPSGTPISVGFGSAPDEQWSVVDPSSVQQTHQMPSGNVQQQDQTLQTPTPKPRHWNVSEVVRAPQNALSPTQQEILLNKIRRNLNLGATPPSQTSQDDSLPGDSQQHNNRHNYRRNYSHPLRLPRVPGSVHPDASRSPSGPELRPPERPFYRPMSGVSPPNMGLTAMLQNNLPGLPPHRDDLRVPITMISGVSGMPNPTREYAAANDTTYHELNGAFRKVALGFSPAYNGDPNLERNRSANVPNELNCSLFLVNLPPDLTTHRLIAAIHAMGPTGRIYATHINSPEPERQHFGCAAKVIFFERAAAHAFFALCEARGGFLVDDFAARVMWNRIKTAHQAHSRATTRVLLIGGDRQFVNPGALTDYFRTKLQFQIDCIIPHADGLDGNNAVVEYRFGSFRCQAEAAKMALVREHQDVKCFFHPDPCDPEHPDWEAEGGAGWRGARLARRGPVGLEAVSEEGLDCDDGVEGASQGFGSLRYM